MSLADIFNQFMLATFSNADPKLIGATAVILANKAESYYASQPPIDRGSSSSPDPTQNSAPKSQFVPRPEGPPARPRENFSAASSYENKSLFDDTVAFKVPSKRWA